MRAAAHAADSSLEGLEAKDTKYIAFNALSSTFSMLDSFYTALSERGWHWGGQVKKSTAQQQLESLESYINGYCSLL